MKPHERIAAALREANAENNVALIPFLTAGYPRMADFVDTLEAIAKEGDVVEIGVPFSDPMADGMTIQRSSFEALKNGVSLHWILQQLSDNKHRINAPLVLMSYLNPLLAYGLERLADRCVDAGVCGFIIPDLPYEESDEVFSAFDAQGIALIQLVTPATPPARLKTLCEASRGFVYAVTITGITGGDTALPKGVSEYLSAVKKVSSLPVCAGFGIRDAANVKMIGEHADGAIVGSALVEVLEKNNDPAQFLRKLRA